MFSLGGESPGKIKALWFFPYELFFQGRPGKRQGALLKAEWGEGEIGHADLHPYPEKGERALAFYLECLREKSFPPLCARALAIAREEARAYAKGRNLFPGLKIPLSHFLIWDLDSFSLSDGEKALARGFRVFKVKLRPPLAEQSEKLLTLMRALGSSVKWRWDFQVSLRFGLWEEWRKKYLSPKILSALDFVEVPWNYRESLWRRDRPWALDVWGGENTLPVSVLVWKTARKDPQALFKKQAQALFQRVVFTHCLAHPIDQLASAYFAARFYQTCPRLKEVCGLVQNRFYEESVFTLPDQGPVFPFLSGPGWGWDPSIWKGLSWKKLF